MLLGVSVSWLILTAPFTLYSFISKHHIKTSHDQAKDFLFKTICFTHLYVNHAINFYIYCLSGKKFRHELKEFVGSFRRWSFMSKRSSSYGVRVISTPRENGVFASGHRIFMNNYGARKRETVEL